MSGDFQVRVLRGAARDLEKLDPKTAQRIVSRLFWLSKHIAEIRHTALTGDLAGLFKPRESDYRIVYQLLRAERTIVIHAVGHRRDIYRKH